MNDSDLFLQNSVQTIWYNPVFQTIVILYTDDDSDILNEDYDYIGDV